MIERTTEDRIAAEVVEALLRLHDGALPQALAQSHEARRVLNTTLLRDVRSQLGEDREAQEQISALDAAERAFEEELDEAVTEWLAAHPEDDPLAEPIQTLQTRQEALVAQDANLWRKSQGFRGEIAVVRTAEATGVPSSRSQSRTALKRLQDLEAVQLHTLESQQQLKRALADLLTEKKRLQLEREQVLTVIRRRILRSSLGLEQRHLELQQAREAMLQSFSSQVGSPADILALAEKALAQGASTRASSTPDPLPDQTGELPRASPSRGDSEVRGFALDAGVPSSSIGPEQELEVRLLDSKRLRDRYRTRAWIAIAAGVFVWLIGSLIALKLSSRGYAQAIVFAYSATFGLSCLGLGISLRQRGSSATDDTIDTQNELDLLRIEREQPERRAQKMLQVNQVDLRRYYDQTLRQGRLVFYLGVARLLLGFGAVGGAVALIHHQADVTEKIAVAALGGLAAVLGNFIGVVYLRMFSDITSSVSSFHTRLVATHDLYFGSFLASKVSDTGRREQLLGQLALEVGKHRTDATEAASRSGTTSGADRGSSQAPQPE